MRTAFALAWALLPGLLCAAPAAPDKDAPAGAVEKVRQALDQPVTLQIDKQTLAAAVEALRQKMKINIVLDNLTIQQQLGFAPDQSPAQVQVDLKDVKARTVLRNILAPYNLSFAIIGDTVVVTTEDMAAMRQMRQRVSVNLSKVELTAALRQIGRETATNLIVDVRAEKEARAEVSLQLEDVPLETAVRLLSEMAGLKPVRVGNTLFVTKKEIAADLRNDPAFAPQNPPGTNVYAAPNGQVFLTPGGVFANVQGGTAIYAPVQAVNPGSGVSSTIAPPGPGAAAPAPPNANGADPNADKPPQDK